MTRRNQQETSQSKQQHTHMHRFNMPPTRPSLLMKGTTLEPSTPAAMMQLEQDMSHHALPHNMYSNQPVPLSALHGLNSISPQKRGKVTSLLLLATCALQLHRAILSRTTILTFGLTVSKPKTMRSSHTFYHADTTCTIRASGLGWSEPTAAPSAALNSTWSNYASTLTRRRTLPTPSRTSSNKQRSIQPSSSTRIYSRLKNRVSYVAPSAVNTRSCTVTAATALSMSFAPAIQTARTYGTATLVQETWIR